MLICLAASGVALASRPPEALEAERRAAEAEVRDLERRARALDQQAQARREQLKKRVRALYKLSSGGYLRLLARADDAAELSARHEAVRRVLSRDLAELEAISEEAATVAADHARRAEVLARTLALGEAISKAEREAPSEPGALRGRLERPVPGPVTAAFGPYVDRAGAQLLRRGIALSARPGERVRAAAAGQVRWVGDVPGHGRGVAVDHGDGYVTVTARLAHAEVEAGESVVAGQGLGAAAGGTVFFELAQGGTPIDPVPWLTR